MDVLSEGSDGPRILTARHISADVTEPDLNNAINTTLLCLSYSLQPDFNSYFAVIQTYAWVIWSCALLVLLAICAVYILSLRAALRHWSDSRTSVAIVLGVYPLVAAAGFIAIVVPRARIIAEALAQQTVMIAMYHLYFLLIAECGGVSQLVRRAADSRLETRVLPCCCWPCCVIPRPQIHKKSLSWLRYLVLQMPVIQAILYVIVLILWAEDMSLYLSTFVYIQPFIAASILPGVWGVIMSVRAAEATGATPRQRFFALQLVLLIVKLQCALAKILPEILTLPCIVALHPSVVVNLIQNVLMIGEMFLLSLWAWRLYRVPPGKIVDKVQRIVVAVLDETANSMDTKSNGIDSLERSSHKSDMN